MIRPFGSVSPPVWSSITARLVASCRHNYLIFQRFISPKLNLREFEFYLWITFQTRNPQTNVFLEAQGHRGLSLPEEGKTPSSTNPVKHGGGGYRHLLVVRSHALLALLNGHRYRGLVFFRLQGLPFAEGKQPRGCDVNEWPR